MQILNLYGAFLAVVFAVAIARPSATFAEPATAGPLLTGLQRPCALAVRPGGTADRFEIYIADGGTGRVLRWSNRASKESSEVIRGLVPAASGDHSQQTGPHAMLFLDPGLLVVGTSFDGEHSVLRTFELPEDGEAAATEQTSDKSPKRASAGMEQGQWVAALARVRANETVPDTLAVATRGPGPAVALYKARIQAGIIGPMQRFVPESVVGPANLPVALASSSTGRFVVAVGGSDELGHGSRINFLHPTTGNIELEFATDLPHIVALAYSPTNGSLYAATQGAGRADADGVYRIDDASEPGHPACKTVKIAAVSHPTAIAFGPDAAIYITTDGTADNNGTLQTITGDM